MALLTIGAKLAAVKVGMTVGALHADVAEDHTGMAPHAGNIHVHAAQRIFRRVVTELRRGAQRPPGSAGVAAFTRNVQGSVRAYHLGARDRLRLLRGGKRR